LVAAFPFHLRHGLLTIPRPSERIPQARFASPPPDEEKVIRIVLNDERAREIPQSARPNHWQVLCLTTSS
jgi:hypothetical protein